MNLQFNIEYNTVFGEDLVLNIAEQTDSVRSAYTPYRMSTEDGCHWFCNLDLQPDRSVTALSYYYSVDKHGHTKRQEWTAVQHLLQLSAVHASVYRIYDPWLDIPEDSYRYTSAFTDGLYHTHGAALQQTSYRQTVRIVVRAPGLQQAARPALSGNVNALGEWSSLKALDMVQHRHHEWMIDLDAKQLAGQHIEFKFLALNHAADVTPIWEMGNNRTIDIPQLNDGEVVVYHLQQAVIPVESKVRMAGTLVPVFSLRTKGSFGVGDFGDLKTMIDLVAVTGQRVLQLLPINDTTSAHTKDDSYPYSCISIFALHPQYCDLRQLPVLKDERKMAYFAALQQQLNVLPELDYEQVNRAKTEYLRLLFEQEGSRMMSTDTYKAFFKKSEEWLVPYAYFCYLRDMYGTANFTQWPDHHTWDEAHRKTLSTVRSKAYRQVAFYYFVQYILYTQMTAAHHYARSKQVILKGDVPIGVNRYGCDVWVEPKYFNMDEQAGAPPDDFSVNGQNWGFPTYNWDRMLADDCTWWMRRFQNMAEYFDAYRIDHVLGFFRIWAIPITAVHGLVGQFSPSLGLSCEEIAAYGFHFREQLHTQPYIREWMLDDLFGQHKQEVVATYLDHLHDDVFRLNENYNTERKIEAAFEENEHTCIRDGLYTLAANVLFVRDKKFPTLFHPRITAQHNFVYKSLSDTDKEAFDALYNEYYYRRNNRFWYDEAMKKLPKLVQVTRMLACAEDLGMVPDCVAWVMNELRILSLEVQSMPKEPGKTFGCLPDNPYLSVSTISSHDMPTLRQWWDEDHGRTQQYYNTMLRHDGPAPHPLPGWLAKEIVAQHLASPSMLCILSIQDWLAVDERLRRSDASAERINIPSNPKHYWRYRMHLNIEDLMADHEFATAILEMNRLSGRMP